MLRNLLVQEYLFNKKNLLIFAVMLPLFFVFYPILVDEGGVVVGFCFAYIGILPATIPAKEHRYRTAAITCSMPVTRKQVVRSKYLAALIFCAVGIALFLLVSAINPMLQFPLQQIFNLKTIATGIFVLSICLAVLFPIIMRFGIMGIMIVLIIFQVLGSAMLLLASQLSRGFRGGIDAVFKTIGGAFQFLQSTFGSPGYPLFLLAAAGILIFLSHVVCIAVFRRKAL
jgi:ABC-type transport system involved in multi-copper enzyme maturation permease subunit